MFFLSSIVAYLAVLSLSFFNGQLEVEALLLYFNIASLHQPFFFTLSYFKFPLFFFPFSHGLMHRS